MAQKKNWLVPTVIFLLAALLGGVVWYFRDYFEPGPAQVLPLSNCDLHDGPCTAVLPNGGEVAFSILPRSIPLTKPLKLQVQVKGVKARKVEVDFSGVTMNMGYNRPRLSAKGEGSFEGEGLLPVCIRQRMDWEAKLMVDTPEGLFIIPYRFETVK
ncbi:MAG TPA: hypothetical protein EYP34_02960 [Chromatiaceae bacterium]|nr:hypothetical protein [Chromatiaceae bacterium]